MAIEKSLVVDLSQQTLILYHQQREVDRYRISSASNGPGQASGSECTPLGRHIVRARIGDQLPIGAVFVGRRWTGEIYTPELAAQFPQRDWILTRILWLSGLEVGYNRLGKVDSMRRFIYIHGTPDTEPMGQAASHGCIRMRNQDIVSLFAQVDARTEVEIRDH